MRQYRVISYYTARQGIMQYNITLYFNDFSQIHAPCSRHVPVRMLALAAVMPNCTSRYLGKNVA